MDINEHKQAQHEQRIQNYILNKMSDEEATAFEIEYLADQACIEQLEIAKKLYQGLCVIADDSDALIAKNNSSTQVVADKDVDKMVIKTPKWWQKNVPSWSIAATVLVMLLPFTFLQSAKNIAALPSAPIRVINIEMADFRGAKNNTLTVDNTNQQLILSTYIDTDRKDLVYPTYDFTLYAQHNNNAVMTLANISLNQDNMLYFNLGQNKVENGQYHYSIIGKTKKGEYTTLKEGQLTIKNKL